MWFDQWVHVWLHRDEEGCDTSTTKIDSKMRRRMGIRCRMNGQRPNHHMPISFCGIVAQPDCLVGTGCQDQQDKGSGPDHLCRTECDSRESRQCRIDSIELHHCQASRVCLEQVGPRCYDAWRQLWPLAHVWKLDFAACWFMTLACRLDGMGIWSRSACM